MHNWMSIACPRFTRLGWRSKGFRHPVNSVGKVRLSTTELFGTWARSCEYDELKESRCSIVVSVPPSTVLHALVLRRVLQVAIWGILARPLVDTEADCSLIYQIKFQIMFLLVTPQYHY